jgi:photosystem II stability/assembly factor-like uncharacterized protein
MGRRAVDGTPAGGPLISEATALGVVALSRYMDTAVRCLGSRGSLLAVAVLIVNDHLLKSLYPSALTGKLSDVAGLYFLPYLLLLWLFALVELARRTAQGGRGRLDPLPVAAADALVASTFVAVGTVFVALKLSSDTAGPILWLLASISGRVHDIVADPTDLVALGALSLAYWYWRRRATVWSRPIEAERAASLEQQYPRWRGIGRGLVVAIASLATVATLPNVPPVVVAVQAHPRDHGTLYAGQRNTKPAVQAQACRLAGPHTHWARSSDGGNRWQNARSLDDATQVVPDPWRQAGVYACRAGGVWWVDEGGQGARLVWAAAEWEAPPDDPRFPPRRTLLVPTWQADLVYLATGERLLRTYDAGASWVELAVPGPAGERVSAVTADPSVAGRLYLLQRRDRYRGVVSRSEDWGETWEPIRELDIRTDSRSAVLIVHPRNSMLLLMVTDDVLQVSWDAGHTWTLRWGGRELDEMVMGIAFHPTADGVIYAAAGPAGLLRSTDAGASWSTWLPEASYDVVVTGAPSPRHVVAVGRRGIYRDRGELRWP